MTVEQLALQLGCRVACGGEGLKKEVTSGYCGDLLSWVMSRAGKGSAWVTVMGNVNAVAVAVLSEAACMILAEGVKPDPKALGRAAENGVAVLESDKSAFELAVALGRALGR